MSDCLPSLLGQFAVMYSAGRVLQVCSYGACVNRVGLAVLLRTCAKELCWLKPGFKLLVFIAAMSSQLPSAQSLCLCMSVCFVFVFVCLGRFVCLSVSVSLCLCLSVCLSLSFSLSVCLSVCLSLFLFCSLSVFPSPPPSPLYLLFLLHSLLSLSKESRQKKKVRTLVCGTQGCEFETRPSRLLFLLIFF